ncbi:hypothetical protein [Embleya sp. NBC_00896]|uniref:hypothetical protein n=1 Tax=Embleya sp. NBC_00896 TaxID=2975961 RepID=UPI002F913036|nr:hypothetical protein OG928_43345 [Embleya sp. NBC_00896]
MPRIRELADGHREGATGTARFLDFAALPATGPGDAASCRRAPLRAATDWVTWLEARGAGGLGNRVAAYS